MAALHEDDTQVYCFKQLSVKLCLFVLRRKTLRSCFLVRKVCFCFTKEKHFGVKIVYAGLSDECFEGTPIEDMCCCNKILVKDNVNNDDLMG